MADEGISYRTMVNDEGVAMACTTHSGDFGLPGDRTSPIANGTGAQRQREVDREIARLLVRSGGRITDSMEREMIEKALVSHWSLPQ